jgi:hypothetical protein
VALALPPLGTDVDYQLGGAAPAPAHVGIVVRDRSAHPQPGRYNVCYVNGFQTQPDERAFWRRHWALVLKEEGRPVVDEAWGEWLLDLRTSDRRLALSGSSAAGWRAVLPTGSTRSSSTTSTPGRAATA